MHSGAGIGEKNNISVTCMNFLKCVFFRILELTQLICIKSVEYLFKPFFVGGILLCKITS